MQPDSTRYHARTAPALASERSPAQREPERPSKPSAPRLERRADGKLWLLSGGGAVPVELVRCFPWSRPRSFLSLRNTAGEEQALIEDPDALDAASRAAIDATLRHSSFVLEVLRILAVEEDFELRSWRVETRHGPRAFQTPLDAWPRELPDGALVLEDVCGDLYCVNDPRGLDAKSRKLLWAFVD